MGGPWYPPCLLRELKRRLEHQPLLHLVAGVHQLLLCLVLQPMPCWGDWPLLG